MKTTTLFQLGGIAVLLSAVLNGIINLRYFLSGQPDSATALVLWMSYFSDTLFVLGLGALFARQSQRAGLLGLVGYVLLMVANMFFFGAYAVQFGVAAGVISDERIAQVPAYALSISIVPWIQFAGLFVFGISIYSAQVFPKYAGALLVLVAVARQLTGLVDFAAPIFAVSSVVAWAWLGWALLREKRVVSLDPTPAT